ncbi:lipopolysaccharide biosynthesis protein [Paenibacillus sp. FSL R7-0179]|uniref:lipopolysaccharide biosynthesis protein n=1 Tax=Paenibacillus sp. FSL R7-0179 TaxID=2921672 RepID=UPI0030F9BD51
MNSIISIFKNENTKAGGFYLIGNLFDKAILFLTIPIFTRLMSTSDYGIVNTYMSWVSILSLVVGLSLGHSIRTAFIDFKENFEAYISSILFLSFLNFLVSSVLILIIMYSFFKEVNLILVIFCLVQSYMTFIINCISIKYMMTMEYIKKTILLALPNVLITVLSIALLVNIENNQALGRIIPYIMVTSVVGIYLLVSSFVKGKKIISKIYWKYSISLSIPLIFHGLSMNILSVADRIMITAFRSAAETGIFSLVYSLSMIALVVTSSMESVWIPWFTKKLQQGEKNIINKRVNLYIELVVVVIIGLLLISPEILVFMAPEEYWGGRNLIPPVVLASFIIFLYSISVDLEYYYKSTKVIATNTVIAAMINIGLNFIFIPHYGAIAAAFTTVIAYAVSFGIHYRAARKLDNELFPIKIYLKPVITVLFATVLTYSLMDYASARWGIAIVGFGLYTFISLKNDRFSFVIN